MAGPNNKQFIPCPCGFVGTLISNRNPIIPKRLSDFDWFQRMAYRKGIRSDGDSSEFDGEQEDYDFDSTMGKKSSKKGTNHYVKSSRFYNNNNGDHDDDVYTDGYYMNDYDEGSEDYDDEDEFDYDDGYENDNELDFDAMTTVGSTSSSSQWEWETYRKSTHVYLPPPVISSVPDSQNVDMPQLPQSIIHFIGGTLFGSYPLQFYKQMLQQIAIQSNSIIVATSIPVTLSKNPLNHYLLAKNIVMEFNRAYQNVIVDEYGEDIANEMKIVGLGHSLGSRLQMIISTSKKLKRIGFERDGNVLIAFNNYNAYASVPGVKRLENEIQDTIQGAQNRQSGKKRRDTRYEKTDAFLDEYEIGLSDVVSAVTEGIQDKVSSFKTAMTPDLDRKSLEFQPSPQELWDGIHKNYNVNKTLVVQFDQDWIDQSSRLATAIVESEPFQSVVAQSEDRGGGDGKDVTASTIQNQGIDGSAGNVTATSGNVQGKDSRGVSKDIKFARLRGTHLSPVSYSDTFVVQAIKRTGAFGQDQILQEAIQEENDYRPSSNKMRKRVLNQDMDMLTATISKYVTAIIVGDDGNKSDAMAVE